MLSAIAVHGVAVVPVALPCDDAARTSTLARSAFCSHSLSVFSERAPFYFSRAEKFGVISGLPAVNGDSSDYDDDDGSGCRERDGGVR